MRTCLFFLVALGTALPLSGCNLGGCGVADVVFPSNDSDGGDAPPLEMADGGVGDASPDGALH